jgi:hypothetical protein
MNFKLNDSAIKFTLIDKSIKFKLYAETDNTPSPPPEYTILVDVFGDELTDDLGNILTAN